MTVAALQPLRPGGTNMSPRALISVAILSIFTITGTAQPAGFLRGVVHDPQHHPLAGASITLRTSGKDTKWSAQSDANGEFQFTSLPAGAYDVSAEAPGFRPLTQRVSVAAGANPVLHLPLGLSSVRT